MALILVAGVAVACVPMSTVEYRGEEIKLSRWYPDYDVYKNDPGNLRASEVARVQALVRSAPAGPEVGTWKEVSGPALDITFPGYGSGSLKSDWSTIRAFTFEIPQANEERVLVFRADGAKWRRTDDFILAGTPGEVRELDGQLLFLDFGGRRIASRPLKATEVPNARQPLAGGEK
jgi:hypothetical protein